MSCCGALSFCSVRIRSWISVQKQANRINKKTAPTPPPHPKQTSGCLGCDSSQPSPPKQTSGCLGWCLGGLRSSISGLADGFAWAARAHSTSSLPRRSRPGPPMPRSPDARSRSGVYLRARCRRARGTTIEIRTSLFTYIGLWDPLPVKCGHPVYLWWFVGSIEF